MRDGISIENALVILRETSSPVEHSPYVVPSSRTSTKAEGSTTDASTSGDPSTADVWPSTADRSGVSTWDVLRFAYAHGCEGTLSKSGFVTWRLRLDVESGRRFPYAVGAIPLPDSVHPTVRRSFDGFVYLLACRWLHTPFAPAPWTHDFASRWCGISTRQAKDARRQLVHLSALIHVGDSQRAKLWLPWGVQA
jgi:hypothetical protein